MEYNATDLPQPSPPCRSRRMEIAEDGTVLIWSCEHYAWWRPDACGYITAKHRAGRWPRTVAERMTQYCGPEKKIELQSVSGGEEIRDVDDVLNDLSTKLMSGIPLDSRLMWDEITRLRAELAAAHRLHAEWTVALATARAAGFADGVEKAATRCDEKERLYRSVGSHGPANDFGQLAHELRALPAPREGGEGS